MRNILGAVFAIAMLILPTFTFAATLTDSQVNAILALLSSFNTDSSTVANVKASLLGTATGSTSAAAFCYTFNNDLAVGNSGMDVSELNQVLMAPGSSSSGNGQNFSGNTAAQVVAFQAKYGIRQTGYVGPITRAKLNALYGCRNSVAPSTPTNPPAATPMYTVTYPNGGEKIAVGTPVTISWNSLPTPNVHGLQIDVAVVDGQGNEVQDLTNTATGNSYVWVPDASFPSGDYKVKISSVVGNTMSAGNFTIINSSASAALQMPIITSFTANGYVERMNTAIEVTDVVNPIVQWSSNAAYCKGVSTNRSTGATTTDFSNTYPASGSVHLMVDEATSNAHPLNISLTCYSSGGVASITKKATFAKGYFYPLGI